MYTHHLTKLPSGLQLITVPMPQLDSLTVLAGVSAGSRQETRLANGLFHFLEHLAFKGTHKRPSTLAIAGEADSVGAAFNAFTSKEFTGYWMKVASRHKALAFDILSDILTDSLLAPKEIEREKGVIIEELNMYEDLPMRKVQENFERLMYGDNSMGWSTGGGKDQIRQMKRPAFVSALKRFYFSRNMVVAAVGKITPQEATALAGQYFSSLQRAGQKVTKEIKISQAASRLQLQTKKTEQAHFCLGVPGLAYNDKDRFALSVLAAVLGGGMSSRLFIEIRERRGLAYYVGCDDDNFTDSGYLLARAGVRLEKIDEAIKVVIDELVKLTKIPVGDQELKKTQEMIKGRLVLSLEDSQQVATDYAVELLLEKKIRTPQEIMKLIDQVTVADLQRVAKRLLKPEKLNLAIIGPFQSESRFHKLLQ